MTDQEVRDDRRSAPRTVLHTRDGVVLVVGLVLGAGIFRAPQLVQSSSRLAQLSRRRTPTPEANTTS